MKTDMQMKIGNMKTEMKMSSGKLENGETEREVDMNVDRSRRGTEE